MTAIETEKLTAVCPVFWIDRMYLLLVHCLFSISVRSAQRRQLQCSKKKPNPVGFIGFFAVFYFNCTARCYSHQM